MSAPAATYRPFYFVWVVVTVLCLLLALPLTIWDVSTHDHERTYIVWFVAGLFVLLAIPVSAYGVQVSCRRRAARSRGDLSPLSQGHMEAYNAPRLQKHVIRILWMPCVYGLDAWFALRFKARARSGRLCVAGPHASLPGRRHLPGHAARVLRGVCDVRPLSAPAGQPARCRTYETSSRALASAHSPL